MRGRRRFGVLGASLLFGVSLATAATAGAAQPQRSEHDRILAYWTPQRIANAKPRDFVRTPSGTFQQAPAPKGKPSKPGGGGANVTGASWTRGGQIQTRSGKVVFTMNSGDYICTGTVAADASNNGVSLVISAGHCAYDAADGGFARNWMFIPDFDSSPTYTCANTTYGCWTARALVVDSGFANSGGFNTQATKHDWSFAVVPAGGKTGQLLETPFPGFGHAFSTASNTVYAFGYPAAGKYHGSDLTYCAGPVSNDPNNGNATLGMACDMTGGSSGGPWLTGFNEQTGAGTLNGLNSYGYGGIRNMYGPKFNANTQATFDAANAAPTQNTTVSVQP